MRFLVSVGMITAGLLFVINWGAFFQFELNFSELEGWVVLGLVTIPLFGGLLFLYLPKLSRKRR